MRGKTGLREWYESTPSIKCGAGVCKFRNCVGFLFPPQHGTPLLKSEHEEEEPKKAATRNREEVENRKAAEQREEIFKRLGREPVHTTPYEDIIAGEVVNPDNIDVKFESIGGLDNIKKRLHALVILPLRRPDLFKTGKLLGPQKGVLLYGPPGTGKTMLAKAIAKESGAVFINVKVSNLMGNLFGDAEKLVSAVFSVANKLQPAIIFIDEVDSFLGQRRSGDHEATTSMKTEFMALWDGFTTDPNARVMVLAATNRRGALDEAILRRFTNQFEIPKPGKSGLAKILEVILKEETTDENIDFDLVAGLCVDFSGSDILEVCKQAAYYPILEFLEDENSGEQVSAPRPLSEPDLVKAVFEFTKTKIPTL